MTLEQLSLAASSADVDMDGLANGSESRHASGDGADDGSKTPRLPRWTRQEILVLIQGKKVAENRVRRGRGSGMGVGSAPPESKWASVSGYCKEHGVHREPVQCRKRWSNLAGDYRKIKEWEWRVRDEAESFWVMRNDVRREKGLPGFFDREVYDILDKGQMDSISTATDGLDLTMAPSAAQEVDTELVLEGGRSNGLFSDFELDGGGASPEKVPTPISTIAAEEAAAAEPIAEKQGNQPVPQGSERQDKQEHQAVPQGSERQGIPNEKLPPTNPELASTSQEGRKRRRLTPENEEEEEATTANLQHHLINALENNGKLLVSQLQAQNSHSQLDREQRKDQANEVLSILNKIADALVRIADKL